MEFWSNNSCVLSWKDSLSSWWRSEKVGVLDSTPMPRKVVFPAGCKVLRGKKEHSLTLREFWYRYFSISSKCKCLIPEDFLQKMIETSIWEIWMLVNSRGECIGTIVRKSIGKLQIESQTFEQAYIVDYYCVHPAWRKRGIGRGLLNHLHNQTKHPFAPHFILWEGVQVSLPPISSGIYWVREGCGNSTIQKKKLEKLPSSFTSQIVSKLPQYNETTIYQLPSGYVIVTNTFHKTVPEGKEIYILSHGSSEKAIEEYIQSVEKDKIFLRPRGITESIVPGWQYDSPFQWVAYNLKYTGGYSYPVFLI